MKLPWNPNPSSFSLKGSQPVRKQVFRVGRPLLRSLAFFAGPVNRDVGPVPKLDFQLRTSPRCRSPGLLLLATSEC